MQSARSATWRLLNGFTLMLCLHMFANDSFAFQLLPGSRFEDPLRIQGSVTPNEDPFYLGKGEALTNRDGYLLPDFIEPVYRIRETSFDFGTFYDGVFRDLRVSGPNSRPLLIGSRVEIDPLSGAHLTDIWRSNCCYPADISTGWAPLDNGDVRLHSSARTDNTSVSPDDDRFRPSAINFGTSAGEGGDGFTTGWYFMTLSRSGVRDDPDGSVRLRIELMDGQSIEQVSFRGFGTVPLPPSVFLMVPGSAFLYRFSMRRNGSG